MGSHSEHGRFVEGYADRVLVEDGPVDAGAVRDGIVNNINHLIDGSPQPIANEVREAGSYWRVASPSNQLKRFENFPQHWFTLVIRPDGRSANVEVWMRAAMSAAGTGTFVVTLSLGWNSNLVVGAGSASTMAKILTTTSTSPVDLDFDSFVLTADMLETLAPGASFSGRTAPLPYMTRMPNGSRIARGCLTLRASSSTAAEPRIYGFHARHYIGS